MRLGFSWDAASNIICVEGDGNSDSADFTTKLQSSSEHFGKQNRQELKFFSLGGGHVNQLFVALHEGVSCSYERISIDGKMSKQKVSQKHPAWKEALDIGLKRTVLHKDLPGTYSGLCNLTQRARNAVSQTHNPEAIIELILENFTVASDMEARSAQTGIMLNRSSCKASHTC